MQVHVVAADLQQCHFRVEFLEPLVGVLEQPLGILTALVAVLGALPSPAVGFHVCPDQSVVLLHLSGHVLAGLLQRAPDLMGRGDRVAQHDQCARSALEMGMDFLHGLGVIGKVLDVGQQFGCGLLLVGQLGKKLGVVGKLRPGRRRDPGLGRSDRNRCQHDHGKQYKPAHVQSSLCVVRNTTLRDRRSQQD